MIAFNDITDVIKESSIIMYADDVVLYVAAEDIKAINLKQSNDMKSITVWMDDNEFIINLKETETLLFGTTKRLTKLNEPLSVSHRNFTVRQVSAYKYLGVEITSSLNLNSHFETTFKRASSRLRLLHKIRPQLNLLSAKAIYRGMIIPVLTYLWRLKLKPNYNATRSIGLLPQASFENNLCWKFC